MIKGVKQTESFAYCFMIFLGILTFVSFIFLREAFTGENQKDVTQWFYIVPAILAIIYIKESIPDIPAGEYTEYTVLEAYGREYECQVDFEVDLETDESGTYAMCYPLRIHWPDGSYETVEEADWEQVNTRSTIYCCVKSFPEESVRVKIPAFNVPTADRFFAVSPIKWLLVAAVVIINTVSLAHYYISKRKRELENEV